MVRALERQGLESLGLFYMKPEPALPYRRWRPTLEVDRNSANLEIEKEKPESPGNKLAEPPAKAESSAEYFTAQLTGKFILVKGGTFNMACTGEQPCCESDEKPVHPVTITDY